VIVPSHLAIIIDGNRRWARARGLPPWVGHRRGAKTFDKFLNWCLELEIPQVSVYALSTENLNRPKKELEELFKIYYEFLKKWEKKMSVLDKHEVKVRFIGDLAKLPPKLVKLMGKFMARTAKYQKKFLNILIAYGAHFELTETFKKIAEKIIRVGRIEITEKDIEQNLLVPVPVDLLIRTGGMSRLSNFLLWQSAYAEIIVLKKLWPDFTKKDLIWCIREFNRRQRNFGR
jgi:tritrans,polycis-undecaprenyl-diphosphate synthase [geranylgeranyl-diphosphate specific]